MFYYTIEMNTLSHFIECRIQCYNCDIDLSSDSQRILLIEYHLYRSVKISYQAIIPETVSTNTRLINYKLKGAT